MVPSSTCIRCGACCASYRVSFHWSEADPSQGGRVPPEFVEPVDFLFVCMSGTSVRHGRCIALEGEVGGRVRCSIYDRRPGPCREFGDDPSRCDQARANHGLRPLEREQAIPGAPNEKTPPPFRETGSEPARPTPVT